ncbi:PaaI family thioesterase [Parahaliea sp. F7430]|uniref:PaaI family thioesterase n=1 Tax=Sediminihaliea albiluteola TaxID=2758564 RepID=A0A7W2YKU8_9GAMM|nr:PaaI family thioesterase [Sediminihaliea albiluteola]MBA6413733.1 PaaI family thioesterase [Sediminihaliea albiluteola]
MSKQDEIDQLNTLIPPCLEVLNGRLVDFDLEEQSCEMAFDVSEQYCHSINVVQGGNVTVMLDAAMAHAAFIVDRDIVALPSLEIKVSFLEPTLAGPLRARGKVIKLGNSIAFLEGSLINGAGEVSARATSTAKLVRRTKKLS